MTATKVLGVQTAPPEVMRRAGELLLSHDYRFAKTMPENPHWYTLRKTWDNDDEFVEIVELIRRYGYTELYHGRPYTMLNLNGMKYWTMGAPIPATILINRKHLTPDDVPAFYDPIAPTYDTAFSDQDSEAENRAVMDLIGGISGQRVLDIGCGTGLLLDYLDPGSYTGIDPSHAMLNVLREKHPWYAGDVLPAKLEEFAGADYDLAVCLFGSVAYIDPAFVAAIPRLVRPGGRYVVMFLEDGYTPVTYERTGHAAPYRDGVFVDLPGTRTPLNHFVIVDGTRA